MRFSAFFKAKRFSASFRVRRFSAFFTPRRNGAVARRSALALLAPSALASAAGGTASLPLHIGPHVFHVEVAATAQQRQHGLMGRTHLAADGGMLFVFEQPGRYCFWMRDTPLPLTIAFIDAAGRIAGIDDMQPRSEASHCPSVKIRYALEVRQGEFRRRGIRAPAQVSGLPR
ncbi:MAG: DUF192 domain-containing protein [Betaproteobacteria bacterium]|nr:DUF192 domain-containing protein [Betaproteobacteria bacterium]